MEVTRYLKTACLCGKRNCMLSALHTMSELNKFSADVIPGYLCSVVRLFKIDLCWSFTIGHLLLQNFGNGVLDVRNTSTVPNLMVIYAWHMHDVKILFNEVVETKRKSV